MSDPRKPTKTTLNQVFSFARDILIANANYLNGERLDGTQAATLAYISAYERVLNSAGYEIVKKTPKELTTDSE